jgi:hypothetical protein
LRQRGQHPLDPGQITVLVQSGIVDEQATSAQELADGLGGEVAVEAGQVVDVALVEGVLDSEPVAQDREGANVLVEACSLLGGWTTMSTFPISTPAWVRVPDRSVIANPVAFPGGYIGESTSREIAYAHATGKPISFTDPSGQ